jgi:hypothetical protein
MWARVTDMSPAPPTAAPHQVRGRRILISFSIEPSLQISFQTPQRICVFHAAPVTGLWEAAPFAEHVMILEVCMLRFNCLIALSMERARR